MTQKAAVVTGYVSKMESHAGSCPDIAQENGGRVTKEGPGAEIPVNEMNVKFM